MHTGMLWFDNSSTSFVAKVAKAKEYYVKKYGKEPDLVLVHPSMLDDDQRKQRHFMIGNLTVRPYRPVLNGHIWIGIEDKS